MCLFPRRSKLRKTCVWAFVLELAGTDVCIREIADMLDALFDHDLPILNKSVVATLAEIDTFLRMQMLAITQLMLQLEPDTLSAILLFAAE